MAKPADLAREKWKSSGLTDQHADKLKLKVLTAEETKTLGDYPVASLKIPYFDFNGKPTKFFRVRFLEPLPGFAGVVEKPQRYAQPKGTLNEVYLPPLLKEKWNDIAKDPTKQIYITEGEFKAACGCAHGLPTLGLGGVDVWKSGKRGLDLLPQLREIEWKDRDVTIVFDSDAANNEHVVRAQTNLARALVDLGAKPAVAALPAAPGGAKQGLDDLLVRSGSQALLDVLRDAPVFSEAAALWEMSAEVAYVRNPGIIVVRQDGRTIDPGSFVSHAFSNRHYMASVTNAQGQVSFKKKPLAKRWLEWEHRFELNEIVYEPGKDHLHGGNWNCWKGWGVQPKRGDVGPWHRLLDFLFKKETGAREWFERWCAYPIQHPGTKLYSSALFWSAAQGTGKSLMAYMLRAIYGPNSVEITNEMLRSSFNSWAQNKQFVIGDEITAGDARLDKEKLKNLITRPDIPINVKYMPEYRIRDCINYLFTSQVPDALFVEDTDRRYFIHEVTGAASTDPKIYDEGDKFLKGEGPAYLFDYLLRLPLGDFNPRGHALLTSSKRNMIVNGKSELGLWALQLKEDPMNALRPLGEEAAKSCEVFTPSLLLHAFDPEGKSRVTAGGLARELIRSGFRPLNGGVPVRTKMGIIRVYATKNQDYWVKASPKQIAAHYEKFFAQGKVY